MGRDLRVRSIAADEKRLNRLCHVLAVEAYSAVREAPWAAFRRQQMLLEIGKTKIERANGARNDVLLAASSVFPEPLQGKAGVKSVDKCSAFVGAVCPAAIAA